MRTKELVDNIVNFLTPRLSSASTVLIHNQTSAEIELALIECSKRVGTRTLVIVDSAVKESHWATILSGTDIKMARHDNISKYKNTNYNIILDVFHVNIADRFIYNFSRINYSKLWIIDDGTKFNRKDVYNRLESSWRLVNITHEIAKEYKLINYTEESEILLMPCELSKERETEMLQVFTGIPFNKAFVKYKEFIPVMRNNSKVDLIMTPEDKYNYLAKRLDFYRSRKRSLKEHHNLDFIKKRYYDSYIDVKNYLDRQRLSRIVTATKWSHTYSTIVLKEDINENDEKIADMTTRDVVFLKNSLDDGRKLVITENFKNGYIDVLYTESKPESDLLHYTELVIIGNVRATLGSSIKEILEKSDSSILIPYFKNTKDEVVINNLKEQFSYSEIKAADLQIILNNKLAV